MNPLLQPEDSKRVADALIKEIEEAGFDLNLAKEIADRIDENQFISLRLTEAFNRMDLDFAGALERQLRPSNAWEQRDSLGDKIAASLRKK